MGDKFCGNELNQSKSKVQNKDLEQNQTKNTKDCKNKIQNKDINKNNNSWS